MPEGHPWPKNREDGRKFWARDWEWEAEHCSDSSEDSVSESAPWLKDREDGRKFWASYWEWEAEQSSDSEDVCTIEGKDAAPAQTPAATSVP